MIDDRSGSTTFPVRIGSCQSCSAHGSESRLTDAPGALRYGSGRSSFEKPNRWLLVAFGEHSCPAGPGPSLWLRAFVVRKAKSLASRRPSATTPVLPDPALRYGSGRSSFEKPNRWLFVAFGDHSSPPHRWLREPVRRALSTFFPVATPVSRLAIVKELSLSGAVGKRGAGSAPRKVNVWRLPSAPPVVLPDRRGPRGGLCRCGGAAKRARASDENFQPRFRHATGPAPPPSLIPGAHQVPVRAMPEIM